MRTTFFVPALCGSMLCALPACGPEDLSEGTEGDESFSELEVSFEPILGGSSATSDYPESAILNMTTKTGGTYACSAALIAPRVVLTAGHCVDGFVKWQVGVANSLVTSTEAAVYDWNENGATTVNPNHHDIGLVFLSSPISLASYPTLARTPVANGTSLVNVGRINNGTFTSSLYQATTAVYDGKAIGYPLDYYGNAVIQSGDSGGPDFIQGSHTIASVNSGAGGNVEVLARVDLLYDWIQGQIASHGGNGSSSSGGDDAGSPGDNEPSGPGTGSQSSSDSTCTGLAESENNNTVPRADSFSSSICGSLSTASDADWITTKVTTGTYRFALDATGDANFQLGVRSGLSCIPVGTARSARIVVTGSTTLCLKVASKAGQTQSYMLTRN